jgi:hypothetical protein
MALTIRNTAPVNYTQDMENDLLVRINGTLPDLSIMGDEEKLEITVCGINAAAEEREAMTKHKTGTREEWLAARLGLLKEEKELTRRSDERGDVRSCRGSGSTRSTDSRPMKGAPRLQTSSEGVRRS